MRAFLRRRLPFGPLFLLLVVAAAFRLWQIGAIPPGLFGDEAVDGLDALDVLAGRGGVFFPANYGREGLHMYLVALSFLLFGVNEFAVRFPSIAAGLITVLMTYWLGRELLRRTDLEGTPVPLLAAGWLATSFWHVHFSRFGVRGVFTPLMTTLAFWAFWRGINRRDWRWLAGAGLALGVNLYFYTAARLVPVFLGLYIAVEWWINGRRGRPSILRRFPGGILAMYGIAGLVFIPLFRYFIQHPGSFTARASEVFVGNPRVNSGNPVMKSFLALFANTLQFFIAGLGDRDWFYNLPGRPVFDLVTGALAIVGVIYLIQRWRRRRYLFLLLWWPIMMIPTFLAVDRIPALPRALGVLPGLYFFPAIGAWQVAQWVESRATPRNRRVALLAALAGPLVFHATVNWWAYFVSWGRSQGAFEAFDGDVVAAAHWLKRHEPDRLAYISADIYRHPSFMLLYEEVPLTEFFEQYDPRLRWFDARQAMLMPPPEGAIYLLGNSAMPDRERLDRLLPVMTPLAIMKSPGGDPGLEVYRVDKGAPPPRTQGLPGQGLPRLIGYGIVGEARPGGTAEVMLYWEVSDPPEDASPVDAPTVQIVVEDARRTPRGIWAGPFPYRYGEWHAGDVVVTWHQVSIGQDAPLGPYTVRVRMDHPGMVEARLSPGGPAPDFPLPQIIPAEFSAGLQLLDIQMRPAIGDPARVIVDLVWRFTRPPEKSYTLFLHLLNEAGELVAQADTIPVAGLFPTDAWPLGEPVRDQIEVALPPGAPAGQYTIALGWYDWRTGERLSLLDEAGQPMTDRIELSITLTP
ncbi:MAG TPA: phospholipid carrier-dependent glycosyltransferase [Caldilineae bacterium]|nr:phospholipid carrier-dependent glycosyltransferase [Caldilineae bacterium]